jgi:hypothetical protein
MRLFHVAASPVVTLPGENWAWSPAEMSKAGGPSVSRGRRAQEPRERLAEQRRVRAHRRLELTTRLLGHGRRGLHNGVYAPIREARTNVARAQIRV